MIDLDQLSKEEQIDLWQKLQLRLSVEEIEAWQLKEANRRRQDYLTGKDKGIAWESLREELKEKLG